MSNLKRAALAAALGAAAGVVFVSAPARATVVDLVNSDSGTINGAQFVFTDQTPTGTGVIQPFLRVQNTPTEQGYNTSGGTPFDDMAGPWTHNLTVTDLNTTTVSLNGTQYYKLLLDVNEPNGSKSAISLDQLQFYTSPVGSQTTTNVSSLGTLRYTFNAGSHVMIDAARNHGSGSGDMYAYIPVSDFAGAKSTDFVYMYSLFGANASADLTSQGGFEEWALVAHVAPIPEVSTFFPIIGLLAAVFSTHFVRRQQMARISK
jgi:hypothetical protein